MDHALKATTPRLSARGLKAIRAKRPVLEVPELDILPGEVLAIVGPNGAGKTTLLLHLALLERPSAGTVLFDGAPTKDRVLPLRRRMAVVFQEPLLLDRSVIANVEVGLRLRGIGDRKRRAQEWLTRFGVGPLQGRSARTLSGGEAQRTSLARAFALEPEVLFLDEPFSALDTPTRTAITNDLASVLAETLTTTVLVTHDHDEAARMADRVAVLIGGEVRQIGTPSEVFGAPQDELVASFVGIETIVPAAVIGRQDGLVRLDACGQTIEALDDRLFERALVCLRPEDVSIAVDGESQPESQSVRNRLRGRVTNITMSGADARVDVDCGFVVRARVTRRSVEELHVEVGWPANVTFKATAVHLIPK